MSSKRTQITADVLKSLTGKKRKAAKRKPGNTEGLLKHAAGPVAWRGKTNKFRVPPVEQRTAADGTVFDSKLEKELSEWLKLTHPNLPVIWQPVFVLQPAFRDYASGQLVKSIRYIADFMVGPSVWDGAGYTPLPGCVVIDAKGMETPEFKIRAKLFRRKFGIGVTRVKNKTARAAALNIFAAFEAMNTILKERAADGKPFKVVGYKAADGTVSDKTVKFVGRQGYLDLVRQSRDALLETEFPEGMSPAEAVDWNSAKQELLQSYNNRLGEGETTATPRVSNEVLVPVCDGLALLDGNPHMAVAFSLVVLDDVVTSYPAVKKTTKSAAKTVFKRQIERSLPLRNYVFRMNLYAGNYESIA